MSTWFHFDSCLVYFFKLTHHNMYDPWPWLLGSDNVHASWENIYVEINVDSAAWGGYHLGMSRKEMRLWLATISGSFWLVVSKLEIPSPCNTTSQKLLSLDPQKIKSCGVQCYACYRQHSTWQIARPFLIVFKIRMIKCREKCGCQEHLPSNPSHSFINLVGH